MGEGGVNGGEGRVRVRISPCVTDDSIGQETRGTNLWEEKMAVVLS